MAGLTGAGAPSVNPRTFAGVSSAGFPLYEPLVATIDQVVPAPLEPLPQAWWDDAEQFMDQVGQLIESEVQDAGRSAFQAELVAARDWQNYVRVLVPPSCKRCVPLAGRIYRDLDGFERHPQCFPAGTVVSGPAVRGATRRWYKGELVVIRTAGGKEISATANHPILTNQGWVPANLLAEGSHVVSRASGDRTRPLVVPDHDQVPARIEDVWGAGQMSPAGRMPVAAEDFHGDGLGSSHVDVVLADRSMRDRNEVAFLEQMRQVSLTFGIESGLALDALSARLQFSGRHLALAGSNVGGGGLGSALLGPHLGRADDPRLTWPTNVHSSSDQASPDRSSRDLQSLGDDMLSITGSIGRHDGVGVEPEFPPRWDAPSGPFSRDNAPRYAALGHDLAHRLSEQVELDRVVELHRVSFRGHVYNLTSSEGWYDANGIIVSNCDCQHWPVQDWEEAHDAGLVFSPQEAFEKGYIRDLTKAETQAIEDGADINAVINSSSGIYTADLFGRRVKATTYGTTRRSAWRKANPTRLVRLRPESIYKYAESREDAIRLLRVYGYIT